MTRLALPLLLLLAAPAGATEVVAPEPPARVSPDGRLHVRFLAGPHAAVGRRAPEGGPGCAIQRLSMRPGAAVPEHVHATSDETVLILEGGGTFTLDGVATKVRAGATVFVPMGRKHSFVVDVAGKTAAIQVYDPAGPEERFMAWKAAPAEAP